MIDHRDIMTRYADVQTRQSLADLGHPAMRIHYLDVFDLPAREEARPLGARNGVARALLRRLHSPLDA
ncbi:MAG TPA: hypothetical protein PKA95_17090 [Thermomicrobiales bacterium]|nr:hypothetical protein [Thermomicrobiales bacterium]